MQQAGEYTIAAPRQVVWDALNDPDVLGACITGCQEVVRIDDRHFQMRVKAKIGPVSATFATEIALENLKPPASYTLTGGVKGGAAGFGKGSAEVVLEETAADSTLLKYTVDASVGGKLAQVGSRLVDAAARKMADEFFAAFSQQLSTPAAMPAGDGEPELSDDTTTPAAAAAGPVAEPPAPAKPDASYERSGTGFVWLLAFVVLAMAMILAF